MTFAPREISCPIWGTPATALEEYAGRDGVGVNSPRAGGRYFISGSARIYLQEASDDLRIKLTHEIVDHNILGSTPEILTTTIEALHSVHRSRPSDRAMRLLQYLVRESQYLGQELTGHSEVEVWEHGTLTGIGFRMSTKAHPLFAWSDSIKEDEVVFLLQMLASDSAIRFDDQAGISNIVILPKGYDLVAQSDEEGRSDQAFVAMWFDPSLREAYELGIEAATRECGYRPLRIDQKEHINKIDDEIIAEIRRSRFLIADFTSDRGCPRGGVYFEAGYAFALGIPVIWCCREDIIDDVHFDTRQFNHIVWKTPQDLYVSLKNRIRAILGDGPFQQ